MVRKLFAAVLALVVFVGVSMAAEIKGKVKSVDAEKNTITVTVKDKDVTVKCTDKTKFETKNKEVAEKLATEKLKCAACFGKPGANVTITTEGEGDKEVATVVTVGGGKDK